MSIFLLFFFVCVFASYTFFLNILECCGPPHTVSYLKYVEKIGQLYSQLCQRLAVKVKAIGEMKKCDKTESLELQDDFNFTNLSEEIKEQVIVGLKEKFVHQQTVIAKVSLLYLYFKVVISINSNLFLSAKEVSEIV